MIGVILRNKRKERKISCKKVSEDTKIMVKYLTALEEEDYDIFPAEVYLKGFLRTYADYLGLNGNELVQTYEQEHPEIKIKPEITLKNIPLSRLILQKKGRNRKKVSLVFTGIIAIVFILLMPGKLFRVPLRPVQGKFSVKKLVADQQQPGVLSLEADVKTVTWMRIIADGMKVEERNFYPGELKNWKAKDKFELRIGNVYGLDLKLNGKLIDIISPSQKAVLDLKLDKGALGDST